MPQIADLDEIRLDIRRRWAVPPWRKLYPWWPRPVTVKVLFYADGSVRYDAGPFNGLKQVLATLTADPYHWVRFELTTAHRSSDPSADHSNVDLAQALALDDFDELWIYSILSSPQLTPAELSAARDFMDNRRGGVLITGDHADLGMAFGNLPRAGKMRQLPAPQASAPGWNSTLRPGSNAAYEFADQSDSTPQPLSLKWYWGGVVWKRPHQLLCSPLGPIDIFPDHQHEGEAVAPPATPASEWPSGVAAEVIAHGTIEDPGADVGRKVGVLSAYEGHAAGVGRIVADSTWHHHFDINLRGVLGDPTRTGFVTPGTDQWLSSATKIEHFFLNTAIWLAPPNAQAAMRFAAWWPVLWSAELVQLDPNEVPTYLLGKAAYDALGRRAPQCAVFHWIWEIIPPLVQREFFKLLDRPDPPPPIMEHLAGVATRELMLHFEAGPNSSLPDEPPSQEEFSATIQGVGGTALQALSEDLRQTADLFARLAESAREGGGHYNSKS